MKNATSFFVSRRSRWTFGFTSIRPFVRTYVPFFPKIHALEFSDFLYWKMKKMSKKVTFSLFHRKFENGPFFGQKWSKIGLFGPKCPKMRVSAFFFSKTAHWNFVIFCRKPSLWSQKIMTALIFGGNLKNDPFLAKIDPSLAILAGWPKKISSKILIFFIFLFKCR